MLSRFFIDRPIFASVLSIVITLAGAVAVMSLPVAQYPPFVPPTIQVNCTYPGASAQVVAESVAAPIEQYVNGVEEMLYMSSNCTNDGSYSLAVTFKPGVDLNFAQVLVQNKVNLALPSLPDVVKQTGVTTRKRSPDILMVLSFWSPTKEFDQLYVSNYATIRVKDELARIEGVGDVIIFGARDYSMRVWVDPQRLASLDLNASDVANAIRNQNAQVACGQIGQSPTDENQQTQMTITTLGRLKEPSDFENIIIKRTPGGRIVRIKDVGHVKLGARNMDVANRLDGNECANLAVFQLPNANALETAERVRAKMEELAKDFPKGMRYDIRFDTTPFIRASIEEVIRTLIFAIILVAIVVVIFLQNWRSAIIPLVAVPVAIIGTFAVMAAIGFSINNLTLFGLVLAIGIVVDDAIVVVEAVEHHIERGMTPRNATIQAMSEVSGPVIALALVLTAVFMPCAFISGITGSFFRQFAVTVSVSTVISAFNSLTLSPALAAILLKPTNAKPDLFTRFQDFLLGWFFRLFNRGFERASNFYVWTIGRLLRGTGFVLVGYVVLLALTAIGFHVLPTGYVPNQDKGYLLVSLQLPDAMAVEQTAAVVQKVDDIIKKDPAVDHRITLAGQSFTLGVISPNAGQFFIILKDFDQRTSPDAYYSAVQARLQTEISQQIPDAQAYLFGPPPLQGIGNAGGFKVMVEDRGNLGLIELQKQTNKLKSLANGDPILDEESPPDAAKTAGIAASGTADSNAVPGAKKTAKPSGSVAVKPGGAAPAAGQKINASATPASAANGPPTPTPDPDLTRVISPFTVDYPQLFVDVNRDQCNAMGLNLSDVYNTLQTFLGSLYVNDFNLFGRTWQVSIQADGQYRNEVDDVKRLKVRNRFGTMVPVGAVADVRPLRGPLVITRYNLYPAAYLQGGWPPTGSSGKAIEAIQRLGRQNLPKSMVMEWTEITYLQLLAENTGLIILGLAVALVFLVLAAQYESWSLPLAIILVVPTCLFGAIAGVWISHSDINVFTQIGFVVLVGLASKNAVLIVEFAKHKRERGMSLVGATLEACRLRLRPIMMTSFAFILGVLPLLISKGAGYEMRQTLGIAVFSGMLGVTLFGIFLTPIFFFLVERLGESRWFATPAMQFINNVSLGIFGLGYVRVMLGRPRLVVTHQLPTVLKHPSAPASDAQRSTPEDPGENCDLL